MTASESRYSGADGSQELPGHIQVSAQARDSASAGHRCGGGAADLPPPQHLLHALESVNAQRTGLRFEAVMVENKMAHFGYEHEQYRNTQKN
ncbi:MULTISPECIES: hypothetical protein [unclassified Brucella]|uniref:hypothetical protein n=1 Tax=unclassified Brucella TaxID=2632610 RepID=UPI0012EB1E84|nr:MULTISPECIES: hypothetical protein [unclassified Brucella]CAB4327884.1 hypothetical protein BCH_03329 [Brucella sp. 191011898]